MKTQAELTELLDFIGQSDITEQPQQQRLLQALMTALQLVNAVKDSKHLQKNMQHFLQQPSEDLVYLILQGIFPNARGYHI